MIRRALFAAGLLVYCAAHAEDTRQFDEAGSLAEKRLGLSSFGLHDAHMVAPYMPAGMQAIGTEMHKAASRFALEVNKAAATGDLRPSIAALGEVTGRCVACHAAYRLH